MNGGMCKLNCYVVWDKVRDREKVHSPRKVYVDNKYRAIAAFKRPQTPIFVVYVLYTLVPFISSHSPIHFLLFTPISFHLVHFAVYKLYSDKSASLSFYINWSRQYCDLKKWEKGKKRMNKIEMIFRLW